MSTTMDTIQDEVDRFFSDGRRKSYAQLLQVVRDGCTAAKNQLGANVVSRIYGRDDKQFGEIFKTLTKIAGKVRAKRANGETFGPKDVRDVIGLTAVVQYPDQVPIFISIVESVLKQNSISAVKVERVEKPGYFATHVDLRSSKAEHAGLWCELQIKTMLHDAWSAKMHDLNYKPMGQIDPRLDSMMRVIANSLEAIEVQSETLRDLITEHWRIEESWRRAARHQMFELMPAWVTTSGPDPTVVDLRSDLVKARDEIQAADPKSSLLAKFVERITSLKEASLRHGWPMAAYLGSLRNDEVHTDFALRSIEDWITEWPRVCAEAASTGSGAIPEHELWSAPLACYATGNIERAIACSQDLLDQKPPILSERSQSVLRINLANFLIEREYFLPTKSSQDRAHAKESIEAEIAACKELEAEDPSPFHDLRGMLMVTFAESAIDIREAITLIERGRSEALSHEKLVADAYYELHARLAWRRLLEIENAILR